MILLGFQYLIPYEHFPYDNVKENIILPEILKWSIETNIKITIMGYLNINGWVSDLFETNIHDFSLEIFNRQVDDCFIFETEEDEMLFKLTWS